MSRRHDENKVIDLHEARDRLLGMIGTDKATFTMFVNEYQGGEYFSVRVDYEICGVHYEREEGKLRILVNLNSMDPIEIHVDQGKVNDVMTLSVAENCPFLLEGTFHIHLDRESIRVINREARRREFKRELDYMLRDRSLSLEETLPMVYEYLLEVLPETSYASMEGLAEAGECRRNQPDRPVLELTPPGVPCPHCLGHLTLKALKELMMKWYTRYHSGDDPFD